MTIQRVKYSRTMNLPYSGSESSDDVWLESCSIFYDKNVIITEKMDGECTTIYPDGHVHARSIDTNHHPSRTWVKRLAGEMAHEIPPGWRVCGENVFARHSIFYTGLPSYFLVFGIYNEKNVCLSWEETEECCEVFGWTTVPIIYRGPWNDNLHNTIWNGRGAYPTFEHTEHGYIETEAEGYVVRLAEAFHYNDFRHSVAKYVRKNHVKTSQHWMTEAMVPNELQA